MKFSREKGHATYSSFFVDNEANKYKLSLGGFNGTKGLGMYIGFQTLCYSFVKENIYGVPRVY